MSDTISVIQTFYNGHKFRSRLEARWAVFFDALGIKYIYEPEGFNLPDGLSYLPDFYLPDLKIWVEVKGLSNETDAEKVRNFFAENRDKDNFYNIIMVGDIPPETNDVVQWAYDTYKYGEKFVSGFMDFPYLPCVCPKCGKFGFEFDGRGSRICRHDDNDKGYSADNWKIKIAYRMARQARFEHGETPQIDSIIPDMIPKDAVEWYLTNVLAIEGKTDWDDVVSKWEEAVSEKSKGD